MYTLTLLTSRLWLEFTDFTTRCCPSSDARSLISAEQFFLKVLKVSQKGNEIYNHCSGYNEQYRPTATSIDYGRRYMRITLYKYTYSWLTYSWFGLSPLLSLLKAFPPWMRKYTISEYTNFVLKFLFGALLFAASIFRLFLHKTERCFSSKVYQFIFQGRVRIKHCIHFYAHANIFHHFRTQNVKRTCLS